MADLAGGGHAQSYTRWCFRIAPGQTDGMEIANGRAITTEYPLGIRRFVIQYNPATKGLEGYFFNENLDRLEVCGRDGAGPHRPLVLRGALPRRERERRRAVVAERRPGRVGRRRPLDPGLYSRLYLWNQAGAGTVWFDDVKVADAPSGNWGPAVWIRETVPDLEFATHTLSAANAMTRGFTPTRTRRSTFPVEGSTRRASPRS